MDKQVQFVHALQGKLINVEKRTSAAVFSNIECLRLFAVLGGKFGTPYRVDQLPFSRVLILMDPDVDGVHSSALLLSFFARFCRELIDAGLLCVVKAPIARVRIDDRAVRYAWSDTELQQLLDDAGVCVDVIRFKGIAQFDADECHQLLLHRATRRQFLISA